MMTLPCAVIAAFLVYVYLQCRRDRQELENYKQELEKQKHRLQSLRFTQRRYEILEEAAATNHDFKRQLAKMKLNQWPA